MAITWGVFKNQLRRTLLNDEAPNAESGKLRWNDETLRDCLWWALDAFATHTAQASSVTYSSATGVEYALPSNMFEGETLDQTGIVYYEDSSESRTYLNPVFYTDFIHPFEGTAGFWTSPATTLWLTSAPGSGYDLTVRYWAYYEHPLTDDDLVTVPRWARLPLAYLLTSHALSMYGLKAGNIAQWRRRSDSGNPEHNPVEETQKWYFRLYEKEIARVSPQDRINLFRSEF